MAYPKSLSKTPKYEYFDFLPDEILYRILKFLPFNQLVRCGRICRRFRELSMECISETKILDLQDKTFQRLKPNSLDSILRLCFRRLEAVTLRSSVASVSVFSEYSYDRLEKLFLKSYGCTRETEIKNDLLHKILARNQNLRSIIWRSRFIFTFPVDILLKHLTSLKIDECDDNTFRSLTGSCPNLRNFHGIIEDVSKDVIDRFFASTPFLETLILPAIRSFFLRFDTLEHFWNLRSLRVLVLDHSASGLKMNEKTLIKIADCFPLLETLYLRSLDVRNDSVACLASLRDLQNLTLDSNGYNEIDEGIQEIALCGRLRKAQFDGQASPATLAQLVHSCPDLEFLWFYRLKGITKTGETSSDVLRDLRVVLRDLTVRIGQSDELPKMSVEREELIRFEVSEARSFRDTAGYVMAVFE